MKKWFFLLLIIAAIAVGVFYVFHSSQKQEPVSIVAVKSRTIIEKAEAVGYIKPRHSITVKAQIGGTVSAIYHDEGERVYKGEPLIKIKPEPEPSVYAEAHKNVDAALDSMKMARRDLARYKSALKSGLITKDYAAYIQAQKTYDLAKHDYRLAEQKLALLDVGKTKVAGKAIANVVNSPIDGYILNRFVDIGDPVISLSSAQASTTLFTIANMSDLMFSGSVDEMDAAKVRVKMPASITVGALPDQSITGVISRVSLQSNKENKLQGTTKEADSPFNVGFQIEISKLKFPKNLTLRSGYSATASIKIKTAKNVPSLPIRVVHYKDGSPYVLLPAKEDKKPIEQKIETGLSDGMNIEIKKGVKLGNKVLDTPKTNNNNDNNS